MSIFSTIRSEVDDFIYNDIEIVPGYSFNQYQNIKRCHLYLNSQFESAGDFHGRAKIFFNVVKYRKEAVARFFDIDTKDIKLKPLNPKSEYATLFLEKELQHWVKKNKIDLLLNKIADQIAGYGSAVIRKTKKGAKIMDLRRLFLDPTVENIKDSRFIIVKHYLTASQLREKTKDGWDSDAIERIIKRKENSLTKVSDAQESYENDGNLNVIRSTPYYEVYERFGEVEEKEFSKKGNKMLKALMVVAEPYMSNTFEDGTQEENGEILFKSKWNKDYPFADLHYSKTEGRWLGVGVVEDLFPVQERVNELKNQQRISMEISSIHLFQTQDNTIVSNLLSDVQNGQVLKSKSGINPIVNEERNLSAFVSESDGYNVLADKISFANDLITGSRLPASTPATNAVIQNNNAVSVFLFKRQNVSLWIQDFFTDFVLDQVKSDLSAEHILRYMGDSIDLEAIDDIFVQDAQVQLVLHSTRAVTQEQLMAEDFSVRNKLKKLGNARFVKIKEKLYDDLEFEFDIQIGSEQEDVGVMANNYKSALVDLTSNPQLLSNPVGKLLFTEYAQRIGINPAKIEIAMAKMQEAPQMAPEVLKELTPEQAIKSTQAPELVGANPQLINA